MNEYLIAAVGARLPLHFPRTFFGGRRRSQSFPGGRGRAEWRPGGRLSLTSAQEANGVILTHSRFLVAVVADEAVSGFTADQRVRRVPEIIQHRKAAAFVGVELALDVVDVRLGTNGMGGRNRIVQLKIASAFRRMGRVEPISPPVHTRRRGGKDGGGRGRGHSAFRPDCNDGIRPIADHGAGVEEGRRITEPLDIFCSMNQFAADVVHGTIGRMLFDRTGRIASERSWNGHDRFRLSGNVTAEQLQSQTNALVEINGYDADVTGEK